MEGAQVFQVNSASLQRVEVSASLVAALASTADFSQATYVSGTFYGDGKNLTSVTASNINSGVTASYSVTASYAVNSSGITDGGSYNISSSWSSQSLSASYAPSTPSSFAVSASWASSSLSASYAPGSTPATYTSSLYGTASWAEQSLTASYISGSLEFVGKTTGNFPVWISNVLSATSSLYQSGSNVGVGLANPQSTLHVQGNISASSFLGTASLAISASYAPSTPSAFATSASWSSASLSASYSTGSVIGYGVGNLIYLTSASYAALSPPDTTTLYIIIST